MKKRQSVAVGLAVIIGIFFVQVAYGRDSLHNFNVHQALQRGMDEGVLLNDVRIYFAGQKHPSVVRTFGEFRTNKKTNAFNKSDQAACEWALFSALKTLQQRALSEGGNAVIEIKSNYKNREFVSPTEFQCGAGNIIAGVALKGTVVKLK